MSDTELFQEIFSFLRCSGAMSSAPRPLSSTVSGQNGYFRARVKPAGDLLGAYLDGISSGKYCKAIHISGSDLADTSEPGDEGQDGAEAALDSES